MVFKIISSIDLFLIGIVLLIFGFGVYELFINEIKFAKGRFSESTLKINNLDSAIFIANKNKFNGISCHFKKLLNDTALLKKTHKKNLKLQVWTPSKPRDINLVLPLGVDYLQTDNLCYFIN